MPVIRRVEITRFRGIRQLRWEPHAGVNCLIGPGDVGKSTVLDAIDFALSARRFASFTDADFYRLDVREPIVIDVTLGDLPDSLKNFEAYRLFLRGWHPSQRELHDEPGEGLEDALTVRLTVADDLEPRWSLFSERAAAEAVERDLPYGERQRLAPTRLGASAGQHFSWGARSILNRIAQEPVGTARNLAAASRSARKSFSIEADGPVADAIDAVCSVATELGVEGGRRVAVALDADAVALSGGALALHDAEGVPLSNLGTGSSRLLAAGLQALATGGSSIALVDELEHGLEPHRIARLLHALGTKQKTPPRQLFVTTHSPVVVRELSAAELWVARRNREGKLTLTSASAGGGDAQAALRACAEAFLAPAVLVCEGATEVGLVRGLDLHWTGEGALSLAVCGVSLADGRGCGEMVKRALVFARLGYRTALLHDADRDLASEDMTDLSKAKVHCFSWQRPFHTEQQLFSSLPADCIGPMLKIAEEAKGRDSINGSIRHASKGALSLADCEARFEDSMRPYLGTAAHKGEWYKRIEPAERVGREVLGPALSRCTGALPKVLTALRAWIEANTPGEPLDVRLAAN